MMRRLRRGRFHYDFIGKSRRWFYVSLAVVGVSVASLALRGFNLGLEFRGGTAIEVQAAHAVSVEDIREAMEAVNVHEAVVQRVGDRGVLIQSRHLGSELQQAAVDQVAKVTGVDANDINVEEVGPKWGRQITSKMTRALIVFLVVATVYITIRFEPKMAGTAMVALVHDLIATAGVYSLVGFVVTPNTVIAILTILGYSLYDTVIIFDRIKERTATLSAAGRQTYSDVANDSLNQVIVRSINTSLVSLLPVGSLLFVGSFLLGAGTLKELALALFVGLSVGAYSSLFLAAPLLALWKEREPRWSALRARIAARASEPVGPRVRASAPEGEPEPEPASATAGPRGTSRPAGRPPQRRRKRKRRR